MMKKMDYSELLQFKIKAITSSNTHVGCYALYGENRLFIADIIARKATEIAYLKKIKTVFDKPDNERLNGKELEISIAFHHPYVCVAERFGLNAALVNIKTGMIREMQREDYCSEVSSYSIGFIERDNRVLFICQTQWNRLDIFNAETGENLTEREVYSRKTDRMAENGNPEYEEKNYLDYFHSQLTISPDNKRFISNGWIWHPIDMICLFDIEQFFDTYEKGAILLSGYSGDGYNWDRPCTFINDDVLVVASDDRSMTDTLDENETIDYLYNQFVLFRISDAHIENGWYSCLQMDANEKIKSSAFTPKEYGEVKGRLYYNQAEGYLVAINRNGAFAIRLSGETIAHMPDVFTCDVDEQEGRSECLGWDYSPEHCVFYTWEDGFGITEKRFTHI